MACGWLPCLQAYRKGGYAAWQLAGRLQLGSHQRRFGMSVTVVVSMCETEMNVHGAPSNWKDYFREHDVVHIQCQLDDITVKQPGRNSERHRALQKNCLSNWKAYASNCGNSQSLPSMQTSP